MSDAIATTAAFVADAAARGNRPPLTIAGADARGWILIEKGPSSRAGDALVLDEYGDLWWCRLQGKWSARVTRRVWDEETASLGEEISRNIRERLSLLPTSSRASTAG